MRESRRTFVWNGGLTRFEGSPNRGGGGHSVEREEPRHRENVVDVLHAAVREVECNDGFELLGGHGFSWVRVEGGRRLIEKDGILELQRAGGDGVPETDIDLDQDNGGSELGRGADPKSAMGAFLVKRRCEDALSA